MDLRQLRYFVVLAEELHFRRASERLGITQAPLSVAVQTLEREIGGQLFLRTQRRVSLTEIGSAFRDHATALLQRFDRSLEDMRELVSGNAGQLRVGFTAASSLLSFFPRIVGTFRTLYPNVQVTLRDISSSGQIAALQNREIDVGIVRSPSAHHFSDIAVTRLMRDPLVVAMHASNPLASRTRLTIADLRDQPMIFYPPRSGIGLYDQVMKLCQKSGFIPNIIQEAQDPSTIVGLAAAGLGVAVVPAELRAIALHDVTFRPLADDDAVTELLLASRAGEQSALIANFRHIVQSAIAASATAQPAT